MNQWKPNEEIDLAKEKLEATYKLQSVELERISGYSREQAKEYLLSTIENEVKIESAKLIKDIEAKTKIVRKTRRLRILFMTTDFLIRKGLIFLNFR